MYDENLTALAVQYLSNNEEMSEAEAMVSAEFHSREGIFGTRHLIIGPCCETLIEFYTISGRFGKAKELVVKLMRLQSTYTFTYSPKYIEHAIRLGRLNRLLGEPQASRAVLENPSKEIVRFSDLEYPHNIKLLWELTLTLRELRLDFLWVSMLYVAYVLAGKNLEEQHVTIALTKQLCEAFVQLGWLENVEGHDIHSTFMEYYPRFTSQFVTVSLELPQNECASTSSQ
jgi:hypothetical protein